MFYYHNYNAANKNCAFEVENQDFEARNVADRNEADRNEDELDINLLSQGRRLAWVCCSSIAARVVIDGYREVKSYRRVQAIFAKANAIAALSHR